MTRLRTVLLVFLVLIVNVKLTVHRSEFAEPVSVELHGLNPVQRLDARVIAVYPFAHELISPRPDGVYEGSRRCCADLAIRVPEPAPATFKAKVRIGTQTFWLGLSQLVSHGDGVFLLPEDVRISPQSTYRNWPGMGPFLTTLARRTAPGLLVVLGTATALVLLRRGRHWPTLDGWLAMSGPETPVPEPQRCIWNLVGWAAFVAGIAYLEFRDPYYFTQDDALVGELPGIVLGMRGLWMGEFPDWNPYVFMGSPFALIGFWAFTYPPQIVAYAIARHVLGDELATNEVFATLHLAAGFWLTRLLARRIGMGGLTANLSGLAMAFAGCVLTMGRCWHAFVAFPVWLALMGLAIERFRRGPVSVGWVVGVGTALGFSYHAGFPQIAAIAGLFFALGIVSVTLAQRLGWRRLLAPAAATLLAGGVAAPLLLHHLQWTGGFERFAVAEEGLYDGLHGAVLPAPFVEAPMPVSWGNAFPEQLGEFYFFGGLFAVLFFVQAIAYWLFLPAPEHWARQWWVACGLFLLVLVLGDPAYLWNLFGKLPFSKFFLRYTFRFYPALAFCAILSGGTVLERLLNATARRRLVEVGVAALALATLGHHLHHSRSAFYTYGFRPFPALPESFERTFHPHTDVARVDEANSKRFASWATFRSPAHAHALALPPNLSHYYQVPGFFGYDPVVEGQPRTAEIQKRFADDPLRACKTYGVGWHLVGEIDRPIVSAPAKVQGLERGVPLERAWWTLREAKLKPLGESEGVKLLELPGVDPLAFVEGKPEAPLPMRLSCRGVDVDVSSVPAGATVIVNFTWYPHFRGAVDGSPVEVNRDAWERIRVTLPAGGTSLSLRYVVGWSKTTAVGAVLAGVALALAWFTRRLAT